MKTLPTLFSRTSTGAIQTWQMIVDGNKYYSITGQQDGKKIENEPTVCEGKNIGKKNETSPSEQAYSEAQAKWDKKSKTGYTTDVSKIDECTSYVEPMLAKSFEDYESKLTWKSGVFVQNKYNGVRCVATLQGDDVVLTSRKGELWVAVPHINKDLQKFFGKYPDAILDGELYNYDLRQKLNELTSIVRKNKPKHITAELLKTSEEMVRFYVYDGYGFGLDEDVAYTIRKNWIDDNLPQYSKYYRKVHTDKVTSKAELDVIYNKYLADGEEGAIIRIPDSAYENKRSKNLLKYKPEFDDECKVLKILVGDAGKAQYFAAKATVEWNGKIFDATFMGTEEQREEILKNKKDWEGRKNVTFKHNGLTGLGVPNYGRIDPDNCFKGDR